MTPSITAAALTLPGIAHGFFTREGGVSSGIYGSLNCGIGSADDPEHVAANRARVADALGVAADSLASPYQVHGADVVHVTVPLGAGERKRADAMVTDRPGIAIAIGIADCGPVLFADPEARIVGAAHAGWKGALSGVLEATVEAMERLGARRQSITAVLGPTISQRSYEVGAEFEARFVAADAANARFFAASPRAGHYQFDLPGYVGTRLQRLGLASTTDLALCTYEDEARFFSFRRATHRHDRDYGRMLAGIALAG